MQADGVLKLILIHDDQKEANRLVSLLRNAKYKFDFTYVESSDVLVKLLQDKHWDMVIAQFSSQKIPAKNIFPHLRRLNLDLPVIFITEEWNFESTNDGMRMGSAFLIPVDQDQFFLLAFARTLYNLEQRRKLRHWKRRHKESEQRSERLLDSSKDAIAIVQEGTYLYANEAYAYTFGYMDPEAMVCLPVIDTVAPDDQERLKDFLRPISEDEGWELKQLSFNGQTFDDTTIPIECSVSQVSYQNEPALEFLIPCGLSLDNVANISGSISSEDAGGAPIQRQHILEKINSAIRRATQQNQVSSLLYICIDRYQHLEEEIGLQAMESLVVSLITHLKDILSGDYTIERFKEDSLILLLKDQNAEKGLNLAQHLCEKTKANPLSVNEQTFNLTLSIGISAITEAVTSPEGCISRSLQAITELQAEHEQSAYGNGAKLYEADIHTHDDTEFNAEVYGQELLEAEDFDLFYQPLITLHGKPEEFYEVLLRVNPEGEDKNLPQDFIDQLFKTELGCKIDRWVIIEAVKVLAEKIKTNPETKLFINISSSTICDDTFIPWLKVALKASGIAPKQIIFQLREIDVGRHQTQAVTFIKSLNAMQSQVALSHFGLAIEPMQLLENIDVNYVKFDSQVIEKTQTAEGTDIENIEHLINALKAEDEQIIVPFVEHASLVPTLWQFGIHYIQGHFIQPPLADMDFNFNDNE